MAAGQIFSHSLSACFSPVGDTLHSYGVRLGADLPLDWCGTPGVSAAPTLDWTGRSLSHLSLITKPHLLGNSLISRFKLE